MAGTGGRPLSAEELEGEQITELPDREAMSLINGNLDAPVNAVVAANVGADNTTTVAESTQTTEVDQHN